MAQKLSFSYSKLGMYKECPKKYYFKYILKLPEAPKYYFAFGTALHKVMEYLYSAPVFPPLETTLKFFKTDWDSTSYKAKGYASFEKEAEGFAEGVRIIKAYYAKHAADNLIPLANEFRTTTDIDGLSVISIIDRIDYLGEGKISILDYKTGKTLNREPDQLMMYQKLMSINPKLLSLVQSKDPFINKVDIVHTLFYHLPSLKEQAFEPVPAEEIDAFWQGVLLVAKDIMAEKFNPDPSESKCRWCDFKDSCPAWDLGDTKLDSLALEAASSFEENTLPSDPLKDLSDKIDEYGKITEKAQTLKQEIINTMSANGYNIHYGKYFAAELAKYTETDFSDKQKVLDILRASDSLKYALTPTISTIKKLLEGDKLSQSDKEKLKALTLSIEKEAFSIKKV